MYQDLLDSTGGANGFPNPKDGVVGLADFVHDLVAKAALATKLADLGVDRAKLSELASAAATQWTGRFNPREVGAAEFLGLYERAM
jgi:alcohol dehydrogenase class IV